MPPKKINGYMLFISELKKKGIIDRALLAPQAVSEADHLWNALSVEEKEVYKQRAKQISGRVSDLPPLISRGSNFVPGPNYQGGPTGANLCYRTRPPIDTSNYAIATEDEEFKTEINCEIFGLRMEKDKAVLRTKKFLFGHFVNYVETETEPKEYFPAEFCFIQFSIEEGIGKTFSGPVFPGNLPSGYMTELKYNESEKGLVPYALVKEKRKGVPTNFIEICNKLQEMMDDCSDTWSVIYTGQEGMKQMEGCIRFLFEKAEEEGRSRPNENLKMINCEVKVYPVEILAQILMNEFSYLSKAKGEIKEQEKKMYLLSSLQARQLLHDSEMMYNIYLGCLNHSLADYEIGIEFCSLGVVKRWILKILKLVNYPMIQQVYKMGPEKDIQHYFHKHTFEVKRLRKLKREEAHKKKLIECLEQDQNEKFQKIQEENQRVKESWDCRYPYILADNRNEEPNTNFVTGYGRGGLDSGHYPCLQRADNGGEEGRTYVAIGRGRGRGRGNGTGSGNKFFCV